MDEGQNITAQTLEFIFIQHQWPDPQAVQGHESMATSGTDLTGGTYHKDP